jgi:hypothetical protein
LRANGAAAKNLGLYIFKQKYYDRKNEEEKSRMWNVPERTAPERPGAESGLSGSF